MTTRNGNGVTFKWILGVAGTAIVLLLGFSGYLLKTDAANQQRVLTDHEYRIRICEQTDARRDEQLKAIQASLARLERRLGTLPMDSTERR